MIFINEVPKYRKKRSKPSLSIRKSKHRHEYISCIFDVNGYYHTGTYCKICGKIGDMRFSESVPDENGCRRMLFKNEEIANYYKDLEIKPISYRQRFISNFNG